MTPGQETPILGSKKITIHVGGSRGSAAASPAPQTGQSSDSGRPDAAMDGVRSVLPPAANTGAPSLQVDGPRPLPGAVESAGLPLVSSVSGAAPQQPPAIPPRQNGTAPAPVAVVNVPNGTPVPGQNLQPHLSAQHLQNGLPTPVQFHVPQPWDFKYRAPGRGKLNDGHP